jgi:hypothetical protein
MTPDTATLTHDLAPVRGFAIEGPTLPPVLIQVPALRVRARNRARRRRRLRREVRVGGLALLGAAPVLALAWTLSGIASTDHSSSSTNATLAAVAESNADPAAEAVGIEPPVVCLMVPWDAATGSLPSEPIPSALTEQVPPPHPAPSALEREEEDWVDAWSLPTLSETPKVVVPPRPPAPPEESGAWTTGYLPPHPPAAGRGGFGAEEPNHAGP